MRSLLFTVPLALVFASCDATKGSGNKISEGREVGEFTAIVSDCAVDLSVEVGPERSVRVWADDNLISMVKTTVSNGTLLVGIEGNYMTSGGLKANITVPKLKSLESDGSGDIVVESAHADTFSVVVSGSGDVRLENLKTDSFTATLSGFGELIAKGTADTVEAEVTGSGDLDAGLLLSKNARVENSGSGDVTVNASKTLSVTISGSGDVSSIGEARVTSKITGSGKME